MSRHLRVLLAVTAVAALASVPSLIGQTAGSQPVATQFQSLHFRSIGPAQASGRVSDIAAYEANPSIFYVGSAHGGVWKTTNNGATFTPQFQQVGMMSVGDLAVSQKDPDLVWLGTGESNNRQSTGWGDGVWKSTDGGSTWKNMGLQHSYHINRIVIDPDDNNTVLVAATGALFGSGGDRGIFKTTDGGVTWKQPLKVDEWTGANDLVMSASDHKILYASMYQRERTQCCFNGGGPGSGIYKSTDGGDTWTKLTNGLPTGSLGRIALDVYRRSSNIVYAEVQAESAGGGGGRGGGGGGGGRGGGAAAPPVARGAIDPNAPQPAPPAMAPGGEGIYRSDDGGMTWRKTANNPDGRALYFSQLRIDPNNPDRVLVASVRMSISMDGGRTFVPADGGAVHDDKHAIWWDPNNSNHVLIGTDGGVFQTWDLTKTWIWFPNLPIATFYHADYDMDYPYNVCGGMQDNYDWCGPSAVRTSNGITNDRWHTVQGGDGFVTLLDKHDARTVYTESQDGNITRRNRVTGESKNIRPNAGNTTDPNPGPYRFHWDTPMIFSPHDTTGTTLLVGGNKLFKSTDKGDTWTALSPDLTTNVDRNVIPIMGVPAGQIRVGLQGAGQDGIQSWPDITAIAESPKMPGVYYTGTDDGTVSVSKDGGKNWDKTLADRIPGFVKGAFVSAVVPSRYDAGTVYITSDAHRVNEYETHIWVSHDFGATFQSLNGNLKGEAVKTLTEDQKNADVLYIGTETGLFLSLDRGKSWARLKANFPFIRTDQITLHSRDNAMIVATHGRGMWILDHLSPIQEYTQASTGATDAFLFSIEPALQWRQWDDRNDEFWGHQFYVGENPPTQAVINMYFKKSLTDVKLKITDSLGKDVRELVVPSNKLQAGIQTVCWDQRVEPLAGPGGAPAAGGPGGGGGGRAGGGGAGGGGALPAGIDPALAAQFAAGGGGRGGGGTTLPQPQAGYGASNPCGGGGGGRGGGFGGGGGAQQGPLVLPGTYNVALMVDGKAVMTKTIKIVVDPIMQMTDAQRRQYFNTAMDLHEMQKRGEQVASALNSLGSQMGDVAAKMKDSKASAAEKAAFDVFNKDFQALQAKFAAPAGGGGGRGGRGGGGGAAGGGRGAGAGRAGGAGGGAAGQGAAGAGAAGAGAADAGPGAPQAFGQPPADASLIGRVGTLKTQILAFEEPLTDTYIKDYNELKLSVPKAMADANAFLVRAMQMAQTLKKYDITLTVPAPIK